MLITGSKIVTVAPDINQEKSQENQDKLTVTTSGSIISVVVDGGIADLNEFESTNPAQGSGKWIGLVVDTGENDITKVTYNGTALTQADVQEAASVGVGAGSFVLWLKAESTFPKTFVLGTVGKEDTTVTVTIR